MWKWKGSPWQGECALENGNGGGQGLSLCLGCVGVLEMVVVGVCGDILSGGGIPDPTLVVPGIGVEGHGRTSLLCRWGVGFEDQEHLCRKGTVYL